MPDHPSLIRAVAGLALVLVVSAASAQGDPPARVGRLAIVENHVEFRAERGAQPVPATPNWPVSSGAVIASGAGGRAEIWIGSTAYRIGEASEVEFPVVDDARVAVRIRRGSLAISVVDRDQVDDLELAVPEGRIRFVTPGRYRIDVDADRRPLGLDSGAVGGAARLCPGIGRLAGRPGLARHLRHRCRAGRWLVPARPT